jgi:hypothetical protein
MGQSALAAVFLCMNRKQVCMNWQPYVASKLFYLSLLLGNDLSISKLSRKIESLGPAVRW